MAFGPILWMILVKGLEKNLSVDCYDKEGDLSEIIGHSNYLCNHCIDSLHSMAVIKKPVLTLAERKNVVYQIQDSAKYHAYLGLPFFA